MDDGRWTMRGTLMSGFMQDVRYALRGLRKAPGFTTVACLTLALGIGANTAMFSVLNTVLLRPLPYPAPDQLAMVWTEMPSQNLREGRSAYRDVQEWRAQSKTLVDVAIYDPMTARLTAPGELERISVFRLSPNLFSLLGVQPLRGRLFTSAEADERRRVAVLSYRFWQSRFGGADNVVGATIELDGIPSEVVGVLPRGFTFSDSDVWEPHTLFPDWESRRTERAGSWLVLGRIRPNVTLDQTQAELSAIARRLDEQRPASEQGRGVSLVPLSLHKVGARTRLALWMLTGAVFCVLLVGVTNITSLSLARSAGRERELALRAALGASRGRVLRQLFTESLTLAVLSGIVGILVARAGLPLIVAFMPANLAPLGEITLDGPTLVWSLVVSLLTGILVGVVPAITTGDWNLRPSLGEGGKNTSAGASARLTRRALVVAEFALAIVLLVGAGLLTRSLINVQRTNPGFSSEHVLSMQLAIPPFDTTSQRADYYRRVLERIEGTSGVAGAAVIGDLFIGGSAEQTVTVEGDARGVSERLRLRRDEISDGFFETLRIPLVRGRPFSSEDGPNAPRAAIVNETMARRLWPGQDAVGKRFKFGPQSADVPWFTVVGVVGDMRRQNLEVDPVAQVFEPVAQNPSRLATLLVRTSIDPLGMAASLRAAIRQVDSRGLIYGTNTVANRLTELQAERRFQTSLLTAFSAAALLLAAIGIYGVFQYSIATRTREIGIRMAVGAERGDIFKMVVGEGLKLSVAGLVLGLMGALWLGRLGSSLLFGVTAADPVTYLAVSLVLTTVAAAGCYFPARRAAHVDPLVALKYE
jgi:putative ABC transport system permease protein